MVKARATSLVSLCIAALLTFNLPVISRDLQSEAGTLATTGKTLYVSSSGFDGGEKISDYAFGSDYLPYGIATVGQNVWVTEPYANNLLVFHNSALAVLNMQNNPITGNGLNSPRSLATITNGSSTYVWVVNSGSNSVSRFNTDGTSYRSSLTGNGLNSPYGIVQIASASGTSVWVSNNNNTISVFHTDGTPAGVGPYSGNGMDQPRSMAQVGQQVWVANSGTRCGSSCGTISRFNLDGTSAGPSLSGNGLFYPVGIAVVNSKVWVGNYSSDISVFNTDGTSGGIPLTQSGLGNLADIAQVAATAGTFIWVANYGGLGIFFFNPDGTSAVQTCTQAAPCLTMNYAASLASPGDTVLVEPGSYEFNQQIEASGTPSAPITIKAQGTVTVTRPSPAPLTIQQSSLLDITGSYITMDGFTVIGMKGRSDWIPSPDLTGPDEVFEESNVGITFQNMEIQHTDAGAIGGSTLSILSSTLSDCGHTVHYHCIYVFGPNSVVENNVIDTTVGYGIHFNGSDVNNAAIENNTVSNAQSGALVLGYNPVTSATISGNLFYHNANGINVSGNVTIAQNIFVNNTLNTAVSMFNSDTTYSNSITNTNLATYGVASVGSQVWVTNRLENSISRYNIDGTSAGPDVTGNGLSQPTGIAAIGSQVWVANYGSNTVSRFHIDGTPAGSLISGNGLSTPLGLTIVGSQVWVVSSGPYTCGTVSRFTTSGSSVGTVKPTVSGCLNGGIAVVTLGSSTTVWLPATNSFIARLNTDGTASTTLTVNGAGDSMTGVSTIGQEVWVTVSASGTVYRLTPAGVVLGTFSAGSATGIAAVGLQVWITSNALGVGGYGVLIDSTSKNIYNNTFYQNGLEEIYVPSPGSSIKAENNIFYGYSANSTYDAPLSAVPSGSTVDYNLYYDTSLPPAPGKHSVINQDPLFVNPKRIPIVSSNFALQPGSPAIGVGINVGLPYCGSAPDLGAVPYNTGCFTPTPTRTTTQTPTRTPRPTGTLRVSQIPRPSQTPSATPTPTLTPVWTPKRMPQATDAGSQPCLFFLLSILSNAASTLKRVVVFHSA